MRSIELRCPTDGNIRSGYERRVVLEGKTRAVLGSMPTEEGRYFMANVMRKTLAAR